MMVTVMISALLLQGALLMTPQAMPSPHFDVMAAYEAPAKKGASAHVVFEFKKKDPDVNINEEPAPRLKFASGSPLVAPPPPKSSGVIPDPANAHYLDLNKPVRFPVTITPDAPRGLSTVKTTLSYFYCSKRENWCRKGTADFDLAIVLP
ncbi:MAG: hypothetical protein JJE39_12390 [Vicinamibacteria bacterium]|nr:hypothetical protein [Vicinamibacteria bacterium]